MATDAKLYQDLKNDVYQKIQDRLRITPGIKEELVGKFSEWFQGLVMQAKSMEVEQTPAAPTGEGS